MKSRLLLRLFKIITVSIVFIGVYSCDEEEKQIAPVLSFVDSTLPDSLSTDGGFFEIGVEWAHTQWNIRTEVVEGVNFITQISPNVAGSPTIGNTTTTVRITYARNQSFQDSNVVRLILRSVADATVFETITLTQSRQLGTPPEHPLEGRRPVNLLEYFMVTEGLRDYFEDYFTIGMAVETDAFTDPLRRRVLDRHANGLVAENAMKWDAIQPRQGVWNWSRADQIVNFAQQNGMRMRGHTLVWHSQLPAWVTVDSRGNTVSKDTLLARIRHHVTTVVTRYRGRVHYWDVVNEAILWEGTFRQSPLFQIAGFDFILEAFRAARAADPNAKLFYNDYNETQPSKRDGIISRILRPLQQENLIDGMGMQGHWGLNHPTIAAINTAIQMYSNLGLDVQITELDVSVYPNDAAPEVEYSVISNQLRDSYVRYFQLFRQNRDRISNITFWGVTDAHSWLNGWPVAGRDNHPFLFDRSGFPKQAYFSVINY